MNEPAALSDQQIMENFIISVRRLVEQLIDMDPEPSSPEGKLLIGLADTLAEYDDDA